MTEHTFEGEPLKVKTGDTIVFSRKSNQSTGFSWQFKVDPAHLEQVSHDYQRDAPGMMGGGGTEKFVWKVVSSPSEPTPVTIEFGYVRPWENSALQPVTIEISSA